MNRFLISLLLAQFIGAAAAQSLFQAGPMVGHVSESSARVWLRAKHQSVVTARAQCAGQEFLPTRLESLGEGFTLVHFSQLPPATATSVRIQLSREGSAPEESQVSFRTASMPGPTGKVRVAFGSCAKLAQYPACPTYKAIATEAPDMAIFLGDNVYFITGDGGENHFKTGGPRGDWTSYEGMMARHLETRMHADLRMLTASLPSYAIWDDHDYGPDNADRTFALKEEALLAFRRVWANPFYGTADTPGTFSSFRHGPVEVFLMDDRYYKYSPQKHKEVTPESGQIWGAGQLSWLKAGLRASTAPVKIVANGTQFLNLNEGPEGHFQEARGERQELLDFLTEQKIGGVIFLTGDRHFSESMQQAQPDGTLVLDCTSSPMMQGEAIEPFTERSHANQLWAMKGDNYGLLTVDIPEAGSGKVRFETRDEHNQTCAPGNKLMRSEWTLDQLNY